VKFSLTICKGNNLFKNKIFLVLLGLLLVPKFASEQRYNLGLYLFNVGQGQWLTWVEPFQCTHFDFGGEFNPIQRVKSLCSGKTNRLALSHWDQDHHGFLASLITQLQPVCWLYRPNSFKRISESFANYDIESCEPDPRIELLSEPTKQELEALPQKSSENNLSRAFIVKPFQLLIAGDSPRKLEKKWPKEKLTSVKILLAGHHGSSTSTSPELLQKLPQLQLVLISARKKRYHHPHPKTLARLQAQKIPWATTETWGSIILSNP
jgi:competence protein ComEC